MKTSPSVKGTPKDQKMFGVGKIDPAWLAQTKLESANMVKFNLKESSPEMEITLSALFRIREMPAEST